MPTAFEFGLGLTQGRVEDANAPEGTYVFELGHEGGRTTSDIAVGDYSEVSQSINIGAEELMARVSILVIEPDVESTSVAWDIVGYIDSSEFIRRRLTFQGRALELSDIAVSLAGGGAPATLAFRLEAVTP
jgi:hypothetical protein